MAVQTYHTAADRLRLIPASAKRAAGIQYEISLDRSGATASELINVDLRVRRPLLLASAHPLAAAGIRLAVLPIPCLLPVAWEKGTALWSILLMGWCGHIPPIGCA